MHETVDSNFFSPGSLPPLRLPGSVLEGFDRDDPNRLFAFCSVFKMEERKGWKELVTAFFREYSFRSDNTVLLLRTYLHTGHGIAKDNFDTSVIYERIFNVLYKNAADVMVSRNISKLTVKNTRIEIVSEHLSSKQLLQFYENCDAFVLPTHGEGIFDLVYFFIIFLLDVSRGNSYIL